jgi:hypothetical protein
MAKQYFLIPSDAGINYLGGEIPAGFNIPKNDCPGSFQYLGMVNRQDPAFSWLSSDIHLICPVYMDMDKVWLDYSDPDNPAIINLDEINNLGTAYDNLKPDSVVIYERARFETRPTCGEGEDRYGVTGVPRWIQEEDVPVCPKTGIQMKLLCQFELLFHPEVKVKYTNVGGWYKR